MKWQEVAGEWQRLGPLLKSKWGKLTDKDLVAPGDKRELLVEALERHYGIRKKHAELQVDRWLSGLKPTMQAVLEVEAGSMVSARSDALRVE